MARLNATIKLFFCIGDLFFVIISLIFVAASALVVLGQLKALSFPAAQDMAKNLLILSAAALIGSCMGCWGAVRQTIRKGYSGRRILCLHQLLLLAVLFTSYTQLDWLTKRENSIKLVIEDPKTYAEYDAFENRLSTHFNGAYFTSLCSTDPSTKWLLNYVEKNCPAMSGCALSGKEKENCDTSCDNVDITECCPSEMKILCIERGNKLACPFHRCRLELMEELLVWSGPAKFAAQFVCLLSVLMLVLSCLLICYNARDEIEIELVKAGVMTDDDIEVIRRLKASNNVQHNRGSISLESIDDMKSDLKRGIFTRKRMNRISPTSDNRSSSPL
ncbi:hypothetical protein ACHAWO_013408 [Cyclotella atomus]|uniref:Uncharacterized protein n=1 Tax=Cyclotella atomus TaxID=382360 RepID=A0ABD3Q0H1_9STRA